MSDSRQDTSLRLLQIIARTGALPVRGIEPSIRDPISQLVIEALMARGPSNISQLAEYVRDAKGSASRMTVRDRLAELLSNGIVSRVPSSDRWHLRDTFVRRCVQFLSPTSEFSADVPTRAGEVGAGGVLGQVKLENEQRASGKP